MKEIISKVSVKMAMPETIKCPCCGFDISHYNPQPRLAVDFEDIIGQIDAISERFPKGTGDEVKIVLLIGQKGDRIYGHPVEYKGEK